MFLIEGVGRLAVKRPFNVLYDYECDHDLAVCDRSFPRKYMCGPSSALCASVYARA